MEELEFEKNIIELKRKEKELMDEYGYYVHYVLNEKGKYANIHTHGLEETYDHYNLQIVLPLEFSLCSYLFERIINEYIKKYKRLKNGDYLYKIIEKYPIKIKEIEYDKTFRIILPDPNGLFPNDKDCEMLYKMQDVI